MYKQKYALAMSHLCKLKIDNIEGAECFNPTLVWLFFDKTCRFCFYVSATYRRAYWRQKYYRQYTVQQQGSYHYSICPSFFRFYDLWADLGFAKCLGQPCQLFLIASSVVRPPWLEGMQTQVGNYLSFMFRDY